MEQVHRLNDMKYQVQVLQVLWWWKRKRNTWLQWQQVKLIGHRWKTSGSNQWERRIEEVQLELQNKTGNTRGSCKSRSPSRVERVPRDHCCPLCFTSRPQAAFKREEVQPMWYSPRGTAHVVQHCCLFWASLCCRHDLYMIISEGAFRKIGPKNQN